MARNSFSKIFGEGRQATIVGGACIRAGLTDPRDSVEGRQDHSIMGAWGVRGAYDEFAGVRFGAGGVVGGTQCEYCMYILGVWSGTRANGEITGVRLLCGGCVVMVDVMCLSILGACGWGGVYLGRTVCGYIISILGRGV